MFWYFGDLIMPLAKELETKYVRVQSEWSTLNLHKLSRAR